MTNVVSVPRQSAAAPPWYLGWAAAQPYQLARLPTTPSPCQNSCRFHLPYRSVCI